MQENELTVPVIIDAVKKIKSFPMTRCSYFCIENSAPAPGWSLNVDGGELPFIMVGVSGVITRPPGGEPLFNTPEAFDRLFEIIEQDQTIYVEQSDIWLPNEIFEKETLRGEVYRINETLFSLAYIFRDEGISQKEFIAAAVESNLPGNVVYSETETVALREWNELQIKIIREEYHENIAAQLRKKRESEGPGPRI